jgi:hypothetical protein
METNLRFIPTIDCPIAVVQSPLKDSKTNPTRPQLSGNGENISIMTSISTGIPGQFPNPASYFPPFIECTLPVTH